MSHQRFQAIARCLLSLGCLVVSMGFAASTWSIPKPSRAPDAQVSLGDIGASRGAFGISLAPDASPAIDESIVGAARDTFYGALSDAAVSIEAMPSPNAGIGARPLESLLSDTPASAAYSDERTIALALGVLLIAGLALNARFSR